MNFISKIKWLKKRFTWNYKYAIGKWNYMGDEENRYNAIVEFIKATKIEKPRILDLGCGYGALCKYLNANDYSYFFGVDLSDTAIFKARKRKYHNSKFVVSDIQKFDLDEKFDVIVFNEVLYYLDNPMKSVERFEKNNENLYFIFSFYGGREDLINELAQKYQLINKQLVIKKENQANWGISIFKVNNITQN